MTESHKILDLSSLPEQARIEVFDFYEFLSQKYKIISSKGVPATEVNREQDDDHRIDFIDLFGVWSESDIREFCYSVEEFDEIDPEDWH